MTKQAYGAESFELAGGGSLVVARTRAKDIVSIEGSVLGGPNHLPHDRMAAASLAAELLDAGTTRHTKETLREALALRGITLAWSSDGDRTYFSTQCLPDDVPFVLDTVAECLGTSRYAAAEVESEKTRSIGQIRELAANTRTRASIELSRMLFDEKHVNHARTLDEIETDTKRATAREIAAFGHSFGRKGLIVALSGDIDPAVAHKAAQRAFNALSSDGQPPLDKRANEKVQRAQESLIRINDKANIDVMLGIALPLHKLDQAYLPMSVVSEMLGGGFASHLMQTIRERDGLTYGVYSNLGGMGDGADGYLRVWATFSPARYAESVAALRRELHAFFANGLTSKALAQKKEEIAGSYLVGLSTTRGLSRMLHQTVADGRGLSYVSEYPDLVNAVSLAEIKAAAELVKLDKLSLAAAGTFDKR